MIAPILHRLLRLPLLLAHLGLGAALALLCYGQRDEARLPLWPLHWWSKGLCRLLGVRIRQNGAPHGGATLYVANHVSWLDIFCLAAVCPAHFLAKQEVAGWPFFGWLCRRVGTLFVRRGAAGEASERLTWRLRQGHSMVIFPEGTTTDGRTLRRFQPRLLQAALHAGVTVQAVALRYPDAVHGVNPRVPFIGDDGLLPHLWRLLGETRISVELIFCPPQAVAGASRDELARTCQRQIAAALNRKARARALQRADGSVR